MRLLKFLSDGRNLQRYWTMRTSILHNPRSKPAYFSQSSMSPTCTEDDQKTTTPRGRESSHCFGDNILFRLCFLFQNQHELTC